MTIVLIPGLFRNLPQPALTAVITASLSLADIPSRRLNAAGNGGITRARVTTFHDGPAA